MDEVREVMRDATGQVIAEGGIEVPLPGLGDVWMRLTPAAVKEPLRLCKIMRRVALGAKVRFGLRSLMALIDPADPVAVRFARRFGLTYAAAIPTPEGIRDVYMVELEGHR